jgi:hypothetical protein
MSAAASRASCPIIIKVPVHGNKPRGAAPPVAARLQARGFPTRAGSSPEVRRDSRVDRRARIARRAAATRPPPTRSRRGFERRGVSRATRDAPRRRSRLARAPIRAIPGAERLALALTVRTDTPGPAIRTSQKQARKELLVASQKARKSATAAAHNAKVTDVRDTATLMKRQIETYQRSTIDRRLQVRSRDFPDTRRFNFFPAKR